MLNYRILVIYKINLIHRLNKDEGYTQGLNLPDWLLIACERIKEPKNFQKGTAQLSVLAHRSQEHVNRVFKTATGKKPSEYVNQVRMEYAAKQLILTNEDILNIALDTGLQSLGHFYQCFQKIYGISPRRYRIQNKSLL